MAKRYWMCVVALCLSATAVLSYASSKITRMRRDSLRARDGTSRTGPAVARIDRRGYGRAFSIPLTFEPLPPGTPNGSQFVGRAANMNVALTQDGIELAARATTGKGTAVAVVHFISPDQPRSHRMLRWHGVQRLRGQSNYLLGNDPAKWRTHVPHYARAVADNGSIGVAAYAQGQTLEYDLRVPAGVDTSRIRLAVTGARRLHLDTRGDLIVSVGTAEFVMKKPAVYEEARFTTSATSSIDSAAGESVEVSNSRYRVRTRSTRSSARPRTRSYSHRTRSGSRSRSNRSRSRTHRSSRSRSRRSNSGHRSRRANGRRRSTRRGTRSAANVRLVPEQQPMRHTQSMMSAAVEGTDRRVLDGEYVLEANGTVGFHVGDRDPRTTLVIDPTITLAYSSFLGGTGADAANSIATDSSGKVYIAGTTTSATAFPETATAQLGPGLPANVSSSATPHEFFIAKVDPAQTGANSLIYLTFLGGSTDQAGGLIAVDSAGDVAITGTTSSADFPVTDSSTRTAGVNDTVVGEIDPTGTKLLYSTIFGGNGAESQQTIGGIALDASGNIFVASDTSSTNLPVTAGAYATAYTSAISDGFLAIFSPGRTPALKYCSYLGLNGQTGVGGVAVDASGNAYVAGFTSDSLLDFPSKNAAQASFGGGSFDAFAMKIEPAGTGTADLKYATLLGGSNSDKAFAIAVDSANPPNAYVTGTTSSTNFPTNGSIAAYQAALPSNATSATSDAFVSVIAQNAATGHTSFTYSTYLGGSQTDTGYAIAAAQPYAVYVTGTANSWDFQWRDNFQPFNGYGNAFVVKLDTTTPGVAGLIYSTPLGGTSPASAKAGTQGNGIALDASGNVWVTGQTTSLDFASAGNPGNGFQQICGSCQESPLMPDAFVSEIQENATQQLPSVYFAGPSIPLNFGTQVIGATNVPSQFAAIKNGGEAPLTISGVGIIGANSSDFSLTNSSSCVSSSIAPGGMCSFEVGFVPSVAGPEEAFVQVLSNAPGSPQLLAVVGTGGGLSMAPASLTFAQQVAGTTSAPGNLTLTNTSNDTLEIDQISEAGPNPQAFPFGSQSTADECLSTLSLTSQRSCLIVIEFSPPSPGTFTANVDIQYHDVDNPALPEQQLITPVSGIGIASAPIANVSPTTLTFGSLTSGQQSGTQVVTLTNTGSAALDITSISLTGTNAGDFAIVTAGTNPCPSASGSLAINSSCTVGVEFTPQTAGQKSALLSFADNAASSPQTVTLSGTAQSPAAVQITPSSLTFTPQAVGTKSSAQQVTIANTGGNSLEINGISLTGTNVQDFSETNNCPPTLATNANCTASIVFEPTAPGTRSASLTVADNAAGNPQQLPLTGSATQAGVTLSSASVNLGNQAVGTASSAVSVTVTNSGSGPLVINGISFSGANASDFSQTNNCMGTAAANGIPAAGTCTIQIIFKPVCGPVASASRTATLSLTDNAPGSPQSVALSGTGTGDFCLIVPPGSSTSASVSPGQTGSYALQAEAANGFSGSVALTCAGAPANSTCTVAPTTATIGGSEIAALKVSVATSAGTAAGVSRGTREPSSREPIEFLPAGLAFFAIMAGLIIVLRVHGENCGLNVAGVDRPPSRRLAALGCAALLLVLIGVVAGCGAGGNSSTSSADPPTPAGTYTITVTGSITGGGSQSITLTLTVE